MKALIATVVASFVLGGCGGGGIGSIFSNDCDDEIDDLVKSRGNPEEVTKYDSGDYHSRKYWYWTKGFEKSFTWSNSISCETSTYTFTPIR